MEPEYNEWEFLPFSLNFKEANDPLSVIEDFFQDDSPDGHLKRLTKWRDDVMSDNSNNGVNENPHSIYYFHKLTIKLIEAAYLVLKASPGNNNTDHIFPKLDEVIAALSEAEKLKVYSTLSAFFIDYNLPQYRHQLDEWLSQALSESTAREFIPAVDLVKVYENLQSLFSAMWLLNVDHNGYTKLTGDRKPERNIQSTIVAPAEINLYQLNTSIIADQQHILSLLTERIKFKLLSAQAIIYLGQPEQGGKSYLFIITSNSETRTAQSLASMVEESCREIAPVFAIVIHAGKFLSGLEKDDLFYNHALHCPVIYLSGEVLLPAAKPFNVCFSNDKAIFKWHRWFNQGRDFLRGSEFYINSNSYSAALFSLHQSAECILTALIRAILHYQTNSHNLIRLLMITEMFTGDLVKIFDNTDAEAKVRFFMLAHAYVNVSYRDTFVPDINAITLLYRDVSQLVSVAEKIYSGI